jgi:hypothetical protein
MMHAIEHMLEKVVDRWQAGKRSRDAYLVKHPVLIMSLTSVRSVISVLRCYQSGEQDIREVILDESRLGRSKEVTQRRGDEKVD